jgi:hypothetical protein
MNCNDCGYKLDLFMVRDEVWAAAGLDDAAICCLACLERRLQRPLILDDFTPGSVNRQAYAAAGKLSVVLENEQRRFQEQEALRGDPWNLTVSQFSMDIQAQLDLASDHPFFPPEDHTPIEQRRRRLAVQQEIDGLVRSVAKLYPDLPLYQAEYFLHGQARKRFQALVRELQEMSRVPPVTKNRQRDHAEGPRVNSGAETPRPSYGRPRDRGAGRRQDGMTLKEWVYLVWNTATLYNGHPGGEDIRGILDRIGAPYGFTVKDALDGYDAAQMQTLGEFSLQLKHGMIQ